MIEQAVILATGNGPHGKSEALPPAAGPLVLFLIDEVIRHGFAPFVVVEPENQRVVARLADKPNVRTLVAPTALGTAGALRCVRGALDPRFLVLRGNSLFDINLCDLAVYAKGNAASMVLAMRPAVDETPVDGANGESRTAALAGGSARPLGPRWASGGVAVLAREAVENLPSDRPATFERDLCPQLLARGEVAMRRYRRPFIDLGASADVARARTMFPALLRRGAVIFDRDGVLNENVGYAHRPEQIRWLSGAIEAVRMVNDAGLLAFVATNQSGVARGFYTEEDVCALHRWMNGELRRAGAHIDAFAYSPFHPQASVSEYRRVSDCRKPGPRMLLDLMSSYDVDRGRVVMIGDAPSDLAAAAAAGVEGIAFAGGNLKERLRPVIRRLVS